MIGRCIHSGISDPALVMAHDETFLELASTNENYAPVLHFYQKTPSISLGYFQSVEKEVDVDACRERGVGIFRRTSGGGTLFEDENQLIYGLILPDPTSNGIPKDKLGSFRFLNRAVISALSDLGLPAEYVPANDILVNGKKISGCAQTRRRGVLLQHGTLIMRHDPSLMFRLLKVSQEKIEGKGLVDPSDRVTSIEREMADNPLTAGVTTPTMDHLISLLTARFSEVLNIDFQSSGLTPEEKELTGKLAAERYGTNSWNYRR